MAHWRSPGTDLPADRLRRRIGEIESLTANLRGSGGEKALDLLRALDDIHSTLPPLSAAGVDLRSEEGRLESVYAALRRKKGLLQRQLRPLGGLAGVRSRMHPLPPREAWWWYLDEELRRERWVRWRRILLVAAIGLMLLSAGALLYRRYFQPDPILVQIQNNFGEATGYISQGNFAAALSLIEENMLLDTENGEWPARAGVLREALDQVEEAQALYTRSRRLYADESFFLRLRGQGYLEVEMHDSALTDLLEVMGRGSPKAQDYLLLGRAYAGLGKREEALSAFETAAELAGPGEEFIYVLAKIEMGGLLQSGTVSLTPATAP